MRENLKNYTSGWTVNKSLNEIQEKLAANGAKKLMIDYENGEPQGVTFAITTPKGLVPVQLPARFEKVLVVMYGVSKSQASQKELEQAKKTAWRNIHDWIDAQLALIETEMVSMEEVFLPYIVMGNATLFERYNSGNLLPRGDG